MYFAKICRPSELKTVLRDVLMPPLSEFRENMTEAYKGKVTRLSSERILG